MRSITYDTYKDQCCVQVLVIFFVEILIIFFGHPTVILVESRAEILRSRVCTLPLAMGEVSVTFKWGVGRESYPSPGFPFTTNGPSFPFGSLTRPLLQPGVNQTGRRRWDQEPHTDAPSSGLFESPVFRCFLDLMSG